jgi:hypothetical protein
MAAPNIVSVATITASTNAAALSTTSANVVVNAAGSGKVYKINTIIITNIDGAGAANCTIGYYNSTASAVFKLAHLIAVPAQASLTLIDKSSSIYLQEGEYINGTASGNTKLDIIVSYEQLS